MEPLHFKEHSYMFILKSTYLALDDQTVGRSAFCQTTGGGLLDLFKKKSL